MFTNDNTLLNNISPSSPLCKSDHVIVEADLNVEIPRKQSAFNKYYYEKGDYNNMRKFATTEFAKKTNTATNVNDMWNHFTDMIKACRDKFIPHKVIKTGGGIKQHIPWICYERSFSEFYLSIWNQLVFNQRLQLLVQSPQPYLLIFTWRNQMYFPKILVKNKWISEFRRTNPQELKCWSTFYVNYVLGYYLMMQHQPIVKRVNETHEWAHRPYQLLSAPYHCCLYKQRRQDERQPL